MFGVWKGNGSLFTTVRALMVYGLYFFRISFLLFFSLSVLVAEERWRFDFLWEHIGDGN
jgi:hypothetical protein